MRFLLIGDVHCYAHHVSDAIRFAAGTGKLDAVVGVGDLTNSGGQMELEGIRSAVDSALSASGIAGIPYITCMGNHDYGNKPNTDDENELHRSRFESVIGIPYRYRTEVEGYTFITFSARNHSAGYSDEDFAILDRDLTDAEQKNGNPVFVSCHYDPGGDRLYGETGRSARMKDLLKKHPRVIWMCGHSHAFLSNERSMMQSDCGYTVINAGSLWQSATADSIKGSVTGYVLPVVTVVEAESGTVTMRRIDIGTGKQVGCDWIISSETDNTFSARSLRANIPEFSDRNINVRAVGGRSVLVSFEKAVGEAEFYRASAVKDGQTVSVSEYTSRYFAPLDGCVSMEIPDLEPETEYLIEVTAVNFFGGQSRPLTVSVTTKPEEEPFENLLFCGLNENGWTGDSQFIREEVGFATDSDALTPCIISKAEYDLTGGFDVTAVNSRNRYNNSYEDYSAVQVGRYTAVTHRDREKNTFILLDGWDITDHSPLESDKAVAKCDLPYDIAEVSIRMVLKGGRLTVYRNRLPVISVDADGSGMDKAHIALRLGETWGVFKNCAFFSQITLRA